MIDEENSLEVFFADYQVNFSWAAEFIRNCANFLPKGMRIKMGNSDKENDSFVMISYQFPDFSDPKRPLYGNPYRTEGRAITFYERHQNFKTEFQSVFLQIHKKARLIQKGTYNEIN